MKNLRKIGIDYQGQNVNEVFSRLVDVSSENSNTKEDGVARRAVQESLVSTLLSQISWSNHLSIMSKAKTVEERHFYITLCIKENYSARELDRREKGRKWRMLIKVRQKSGELSEIREVSGFFDYKSGL